MAFYKNNNGTPELISGGTLYADSPVGTILPFGGINIPSGWSLCDGREVSKTTYAELYSVIGDSFKGNKTPASGNFCLPDLRECTLKGASDTNNDTYTIGTHQKIAVGEFLDDRVKNITLKSGDVQIYSGAGHDRGLVAGGSADRTLSNYSTSTVGDTTEVKSVGVNYIIKAKMTAVPADFLAKVDEAILESPIVPSNASASNKLVTEKDLVKVGTSPAGSITSKWYITGNDEYTICYGVNTSSIAVTAGAPITLYLPPEYTVDYVISGNIYIGGNPSFATGALHATGTNGVVIYCSQTGTVEPGAARAIAIAHKS